MAQIPAVDDTNERTIVDQESPESSSADFAFNQLQFSRQNRLQLSLGASPTVTHPGVVYHGPDVTGNTGQAARAVEMVTDSEQEIEKELFTVVQKYREQMTELMTSLSGMDVSILATLDDEGLVENLLEEIKHDCVQTFDKQMKRGKHLYAYLHNKGYDHIAEQWLLCMEDMQTIF